MQKIVNLFFRAGHLDDKQPVVLAVEDFKIIRLFQALNLRYIRFCFYDRHLPPKTLVDVQFLGGDYFRHFFYLLDDLIHLVVPVLAQGERYAADSRTIVDEAGW